MRRPRWSAKATADLDAIGDYWLPHSPSGLLALGDKTPAAGPALGGGPMRKWRVKDKDYILLYRPTSGGILIVRLQHGRQDWRQLS